MCFVLSTFQISLQNVSFGNQVQHVIHLIDVISNFSQKRMLKQIITTKDDESPNTNKNKQQIQTKTKK